MNIRAAKKFSMIKVVLLCPIFLYCVPFYSVLF